MHMCVNHVYMHIHNPFGSSTVPGNPCGSSTEPTQGSSAMNGPTNRPSEQTSDVQLFFAAGQGCGNSSYGKFGTSERWAAPLGPGVALRRDARRRPQESPANKHPSAPGHGHDHCERPHVKNYSTSWWSQGTTLVLPYFSPRSAS